MKLSRTSLVLLAVQLAIVSSIAAKYLYQRWNCPRAWTTAVPVRLQKPMRGRYLRLQLTVDGCGRITPPAKLKSSSQKTDAGQSPSPYSALFKAGTERYHARLTVKDGRLSVVPLAKIDAKSPLAFQLAEREGIIVLASPGSSCNALELLHPVNFYIAEHANAPTALKPGQELWVEVTVPPEGPPRPLQLALKQPDGAWQPLAFQ